MVDVTNIQATAGQTINQGLNTTSFIVIIILILALVFGITFFMIWWNSFKIKFRVFVITGTKSLVKDRFAKIVRKKGQSPKWKLRMGGFVPVPRPDEIGVGMKGNMCVEADFTENGEYVYRKMITNLDNLANGGHVFDPLTTIDKEFYANEHIDAVNKYKKKSVLEILLQLAPYIMIFLIFVMFLVFWGKIIEPYQKMGETIIAERQADREFMLEMHDIHRIIVGNRTIENNNIPSGVAPS